MSAAVRKSLLGTRPPGAPPAYFVGIPGRGKGLGVYSATTGRIVARLGSPTRGLLFSATAATADSRIFVVAASAQKGPCDTRLYRLRLNADGRPGALIPLAVPEIAGHLITPTSLAASADGGMIAYASARCGGSNSAPGQAGVIDLATRQVRTWAITRSEGLMSLSLSAAGRTLAFTETTALGGDGTARVLSTDSPAGRLAQRARKVLSAALQAQAVALSPGGNVLFACTWRGTSPPYSATLAAYQAGSGQLIGVLHTWHDVHVSPCTISADPAGRYLLVTDIFLQDVGARIDLATGRLAAIPSRTGNPPLGISW